MWFEAVEQRNVPRLSADRMKVLHIINDLSVGGAEMMLYKLLSKMDRERFDPVVISLMDRGQLRERIEELNIPVYTAGMKPGRPTPASIWRLLRLVHRLRPNLIQGWMYHGNLAAQLAILFSFRKRHVLWSIHNSISSLTPEKRMTTAVIRLCALLSRLPANIVFVSRSNQSQHAALGYFMENSCVISIGFDASVFVPSEEAGSSVRSELGLAENSLLIGLIGRYHPAKDHANFLRAAALLSKTYPDVHFLLSGRGIYHENTALHQAIQEAGLSHRVHLLGERHDMPRLIASLDILSSSSYSESFPNVIGEAMACGVPCAVTDVGDAALLVGETGRVVPPRDSEALAAAWGDLISLGAEGRKALGKAARSRVLECFRLESVVTQYESLYDSVFAEKAKDFLACSIKD
jgi:glycosyltransferase involved in cell wall biosynthesis